MISLHAICNHIKKIYARKRTIHMETTEKVDKDYCKGRQ